MPIDNVRFNDRQIEIARDLELWRRDEALRGLKSWRLKHPINQLVARLIRKQLMRMPRRLEPKQRDAVLQVPVPNF